MDETLLALLDELRKRVGRPLVVNSAARCSSWNNKVGGTTGSAHCRGFAVDISCRAPELRLLIVKEALGVGFCRIGVAEAFIHLDIDPDKPQGILFLY